MHLVTDLFSRSFTSVMHKNSYIWAHNDVQLRGKVILIPGGTLDVEATNGESVIYANAWLKLCRHINIVE